MVKMKSLNFLKTYFTRLTSKAFALCLHCQRTNHPPGKRWSGSNATNPPKRLIQDQPADKTKEGQEQGNMTHSVPTLILKIL